MNYMKLPEMESRTCTLDVAFKTIEFQNHMAFFAIHFLIISYIYRIRSHAIIILCYNVL